MMRSKTLAAIQEPSVGFIVTCVMLVINDKYSVIKNKINRYGLDHIITGVFRSRRKITATTVNTAIPTQLTVIMEIPAGSEDFV